MKSHIQIQEKSPLLFLETRKKKEQLIEDRNQKIQRENKILFNKINKIMQTNTILRIFHTFFDIFLQKAKFILNLTIFSWFEESVLL